MMNLSAHGNSISVVEITNISNHGIWLYAHGEELFLPYENFPWFKDQPVRVILRVEEPSVGHYYWPDLDIDLSIDIIKHPERFPLQSK